MAPQQKDQDKLGPPPPTLDQSFTLPTIMTMQHTLGGIEKQVEGLDRKVDKLSADVEKHGRWLFTANVILIIALAVISFVAKMVWDVVKVKLGAP
jgi:hypothetical protein